MKIEQSAVALAATHEYSSRAEVEVESERRFAEVFASVDAAQAGAAEAPDDEGERLVWQLQILISRLFAYLTGQECQTPIEDPALPADQAGRSRVRTIEWRSVTTESFSEHERSTLSASGCVRTADGRSFAFDLDLCRSRDYASERIVETSGSAVLRDPLVINFDGRGAELSGQRFAFDLDADGIAEDLPLLAGGSAFLAIDRDHDGAIDDGRELFGALSGDGFAELAQFDVDGNGWIDEADPDFAELRVWRPGSAGTPGGLAEEGVGALYLGAVDSPFALKDGDNRLLGAVRASAFYLAEDGSAGALQQVDLVV